MKFQTYFLLSFDRVCIFYLHVTNEMREED